MNFWIFRLDSFGSPFRNVNSGRNTEGDSVNNARFQTGKKNYLKEFEGKLSSSATFLSHSISF